MSPCPTALEGPLALVEEGQGGPPSHPSRVLVGRVPRIRGLGAVSFSEAMLLAELCFPNMPQAGGGRGRGPMQG